MAYNKVQLGRILGISIVALALLFFAISVVQVDLHPRTDDATVRRARVYVDSRATAKASGDIAIPLKKKVIGLKDIQGDLFELCRGQAKGRKGKTEVTLFKSTGLALEDLAAAMLLWNALK